jgi:hypothetical protein
MYLHKLALTVLGIVTAVVAVATKSTTELLSLRVELLVENLISLLS